jgi:hypothetical protein
LGENTKNLVLDLYPAKQVHIGAYRFYEEEAKVENENKQSEGAAQRLQQMLGFKPQGGQMKSIKSERTIPKTTNINYQGISGAGSFVNTNTAGSHSMVVEKQRNSNSVKQGP